MKKQNLCKKSTIKRTFAILLLGAVIFSNTEFGVLAESASGDPIDTTEDVVTTDEDTTVTEDIPVTTSLDDVTPDTANLMTTSTPATCENHIDEDEDGICDTCGETITTTCTTHVDEDKNCVCDNCGTALNHVDANSDCVCDICGTSIAHVDADGDGYCDVCDVDLDPNGACKKHRDKNSDCICDKCQAQYEHIDADGDKACDTCGTYVPTDEDIPVITSFTASEDGYLDEVSGLTIYNSEVTFTATVTCLNVSEDSDLSTMILGYDVANNQNTTLSPTTTKCSVDSKTKIATYTYTWVIDTPSANYRLISLQTSNEKYDYSVKDYELISSKELNYQVRVNDTTKSSGKASYEIKGAGDFESDGQKEIWYTNGADSETSEDFTLTITIETLDEVTTPEVTSVSGNTAKFVSENDYYTYFDTQPIEFNFLGRTIKWDMPCIVKNHIHNYVYTLSTNTDGITNYKVAYTINEDDYNEVITTYVDNTAPVVNIAYYQNGTEVNPLDIASAENTTGDMSYYNSNITMVATVEDISFDADNTNLAITGTDLKFENWSVAEDGKTWTATVTTNADGSYKVEGIVLDKAENETEVSENEFCVDTTSPVATLAFDNNDVRNDKYYNATRTATLTVEDTNFDPNSSLCVVDITNVTGLDKATQSEWKSVDGKWTKQITFNSDDKYQFTFNCTDKATNPSGTLDSGEFYVDMTRPVITVTYDNNSVEATKYYKAKRVATITIDEFTFDAKNVNVATQSGEDIEATPSISGFNSDGNTNTATITFDKDGTYGYTIKCTDLAGNESEEFVSDVFVIDMTAPVIEFSGVEDYSANNGKVAPVITVTDKNIATGSLSTKITGANNGNVSLGNTLVTNTDGYVVTYSDFAYEKVNDDLYVLTAEVTDLAGNTTEEKLTFSVNRFGSVYVLSDATKTLVDDYYTTKSQDVVITEINVDTLSKKEVSIARDGDVKEIKENKGYTVAAQGDDVSWKSYTYTIAKSNFAKDGIYSVNVYSEDRATNKQNNQSKDAEIKFALDQTAPSVVVSGLEENGIYEEENHAVSLNATDNMAVMELSVYLNDEEFASYSEEELNENGGTEVLSIPAMDAYQKVEIVCTDIAGNETRLSYGKLLISEQAAVLVDENDTPTAYDDESATDSANAVANTRTMLYVVLAIAALALIGEGTFLVVRRRKKTK